MAPVRERHRRRVKVLFCQVYAMFAYNARGCAAMKFVTKFVMHVVYVGIMLYQPRALGSRTNCRSKCEDVDHYRSIGWNDKPLCIDCYPNSRIVCREDVNVKVYRADSNYRIPDNVNDWGEQRCDLCVHPGNLPLSTQKHCCNYKEYCLCDPGFHLTIPLACTWCALGGFSDGFGARGVCPVCPLNSQPTNSAGAYVTRGAVRCGACAPNQYATPGTSYQCRPCGAGTYLHNRDTIPICASCSSGWFSDAGALVCRQCLAGTSSLAGWGTCVKCQAGKYNDHDTGACRDCPMGKYQPDEGAKSCLYCPAGKYQPSTGRSGCLSCLESQDSCDGLHFGCSGDSAGHCQLCGDEQFATVRKMKCVTFAKLILTTNWVTNKIEGVFHSDFVDSITDYKGSTLAEQGGESVPIPPGSYIELGTDDVYIKDCDGRCGSFDFPVGCGVLQDIPLLDILIRSVHQRSDFLGIEYGMPVYHQQWTLSHWLDSGDPLEYFWQSYNLMIWIPYYPYQSWFPNSGTVSGQLARIQRQGVCHPCTKCTTGYYLKNCKDLEMPGFCFTCRGRDSCGPGRYISHVDERGCDNIHDTYTYMAQDDYECNQCLTARFLNGAYELLVGCAGNDKFVRWHPRAQTDAARVSVIAEECPFHLTTGLGTDTVEACWYNGKQLWKSVAGPHPAHQELHDQNYTSTMPYCPPGWRVNEEFFLNGERPFETVWKPSNCIRCLVCHNDTHRMRAADWVQCSGYFTKDTQTCTMNCQVGQYVEQEGRIGGDADVTNPTCKHCQSC